MASNSMAPSLIDFHGHWFPPAIVERLPAGELPPAVRECWPLLLDLEAQLVAAEQAEIDMKVICAPLSSLSWASKVPLTQLTRRTNEELAAAVNAAPERLAALASVDAFGGEEGAEEARYAIDELGLAGLVLDASQGELLLSAPEARPTLEFAADRGVVVFAHPVNPPVLPPRYGADNGLGVLLARGTESALSTLHLLAAGVLDQLPGLRLVLAGIGAAALHLAVFLDAPDGERPKPSSARSRLFIDTMGFDPPAIRFALDVVGPEQVLVGSDWPIMWRNASRARVSEVLRNAGLDDREQALVAAGNAAGLLGLRRTSSAGAASH